VRDLAAADPPTSAALLKSVEVAALLNVHPKHVYRLLRRGLPGRRVGGDWRFDRDEVLRWAGATAPAPAIATTATAASNPNVPALLAANGDVVVDLLLARLNEAPPLLGFVRADRDRALELLAAGDVLLAGSHGRAFPPTIAEARLARIHLVQREVGLVAAAGKPVPPLARLGRLRVGYRPQSAAVVVHFEQAARAAGLDPRKLLARATLLTSHRDVVFAVQRGEVDVGLATRAWAESLGLAFHPLAVEGYGLLVRATELARPEVVRLCEVAQDPRFLASVSAIPGYDPTGCGAIHYDTRT
jgi:putative molybdopterin biosynthesis protein